ncbi:MAG: LptF/LptG family permease [Gemmatimonadetes bacterium]|nr:LptF/LptG family permease [Gemmatimonadota bacterium]
MRILTRYLLRAHLGPFLFALTVLTGMLLINTVARRLEELAGKGLPASVITEVFLLSVPHIVALTLPMAVLVAVLYTFSQLTAENEITALKANGLNLVRLLVPVILAGAALASAMLWFNDRVLPETNHRLAKLLVDIGRKSPTLELKEQMINEIESGDLRTRYYLQAAQIDPATNRLQDVVIYDLSEPGRDRSVYADSGRMAFNRERTDLFLTLYDGWIHDVKGGEPEQFQRVFFDRQLIRIRDIGNELERTLESGYRSDREMSLDMLAAEVAAGRRELRDVRTQAAQHSVEAVRRALAGPGDSAARAAPPARAWPSPVRPLAGSREPDEPTRRTALELRTLEARAELIGQRINAYAVEYHKKYAIPFACIVFVLIGAPLAVRFPRGGVGMVIAASLTIFTVYYMGLIGGENLSDKGMVSPFWAMWAVNAVFLASGVWALTRLGREIATTRGGGWDDLWDSLRTLAGRPVRGLRGRSW